MNGSENPPEVFSPPASGGADGLVSRETKKRGFPETPAPRRMRSFFALLFALALVAGCGGENSSTSAGGENRGSLGAQSRPEPDSPPREPPPQPPSTQTRQPSLAPEPPPAPTSGPDLSWSSGVFSSSRHFRHFCADPSGAFDRASRQGSSVHEKHWLRAWSHETYLWYDEIEDVDPTDEHTVSGYFHLMKTRETLSSGAPKDNFHFTQNTREYWLLTNSGVSAGYGVRFAIISRAPPREIAVAYVEPGSPAAAAGLSRGARILEVDGVDVVNGDNTDVINRGLNPSAVGEEHRFSVRDLGESESRSVSMTSANVTRSPVQHVKVIETAAGERVGYFLFNSHIATAEGQLVSAVNTLLEGEGIDDLVIDLRYNPGGLISVASRLAFMIAGPTATAGKTFARIVRNDKLGDIPTPFYSVRGGGSPLPSLDLARVFVLTGDRTGQTPRTCSASESIINGLEGIDVEVIRVGSTTCGKPYGFYPGDNCGTTYFTIQLQTVNDKGFGDYQEGFAPTCAVAGDDFDHSFGDPEEKLLKTALAYQANDECPAAESSDAPAALRGSLEGTRSPGLVLEPPPGEIEGAILGR